MKTKNILTKDNISIKYVETYSDDIRYEVIIKNALIPNFGIYDKDLCLVVLINHIYGTRVLEGFKNEVEAVIQTNSIIHNIKLLLEEFENSLIIRQF